MKFQNPSIHRSKVSNFTKKWKNQSKFQNSVFLSKFDGKFSEVNFISPNQYTKYEGSSLNTFRDILHTDFQILFSKGNNSEKGHN